MKNKNGFTLVELLAVIAILAILVIVAMPNILGMFNEAKQNTFVTDVQKIMDTAKAEFTNDAFSNAGQTIYYSSKDNSLDSSKLNIETNKEYFIEMDRHGEFKRVVVYDDNFCYDIYADGTKSDLTGINSKLINDVIKKSTVVKSDILDSANDSIDIEIVNNGSVVTYKVVGCNDSISQIVPEGGKYITDGNEYDSGDEIPSVPKKGDKFILNDYEYYYNKRYDSYNNLVDDNTMNGWSVKLKSESRRKTSFTPIETYINNKPVVSINYLFGNGVATNLEVPPVIPNTVKEMDEAFYGCIFATKFPLIPNGVESMYRTFYLYGIANDLSTFPEGFKIPNTVKNLNSTFRDTAITIAPEIPEGVENLEYTFSGTFLRVAPAIPSTVKKMNHTFDGCSKLEVGPTFTSNSQAWDFAYTFANCDSLVDGSSIVFPKSTVNLNLTFSDSTNLVIPPDLSLIEPGQMVYFTQTFMNCVNLTGEFTINCSSSGFTSSAFDGTVKPIYLKGTAPNLSSFAKYSNIHVLE